MLKIRKDVFEKLTSYEPIKLNHQIFVIKNIYQIDNELVKFQLVTTNYNGSIMFGSHYEAIVDVEILNTEEFADFVLGNDFSELITQLEPADYPEFLQNVIDFGQTFDPARYRVIHIAATHAINVLTRLLSK